MARVSKKADTLYKNAYQRENYDRVGVLLPKGTKDRLKAKLGGQSVNSYISGLVLRDIDKECKITEHTTFPNVETTLKHYKKT